MLASPVRVCAGGDVMLGGNLDTAWAVRLSRQLHRHVPALPDPGPLVAPLQSLVRDADIVVLNVEGAIGEGLAPRKCRRGSRNCYAFRQVPAVAAALAGLAPSGAVVGNVANNHSMDAGPQGFEETVRHLSGAGVSVTGADTVPTLVAVRGADTVAVLGFSVFTAGPDAHDLPAVHRLVARAAGRYRVVVVMHVGAEGFDAQRTPDRDETYLGEDRGNSVAIARTAIAAGASLVVGHGPHVLRAMEWRGDRLIAYSLGNLVTYGPFSLVEPLDRGGILCATLAPNGAVTEAELRSTVQTAPGHVAVDPSNRAAQLVDSLSALDFPQTAVGVRGTSVLVRTPSAASPGGR
jgi:hypothetical protein